MSKPTLQSILERPEPPDTRRRLALRLSTFGIPLGLLLGTTLLLAFLFGDRLLPTRRLEVVTVVTAPAAASTSAEGSKPAANPFEAPMHFQASGWVEPKPYPTKVSALVPGVVDKVFVLAGEAVRKGDVLATLIDDDARLDVSTAEANLALALARQQSATTAIEAAHAETRRLSARLEAASAILHLRTEEARRFKDAGAEAVAAIEIIERQQMALSQEAETEALQAELEASKARIKRLDSELTSAEAAVILARTDLARRQLALERTSIQSPMDGRVMRLLVTPGQQRMAGGENRDSAAIAYLFDPQSLQARIDVPLADASQLHLGQSVRIRCQLLPEAILHGRVYQIDGQADLQRNTLQAKVEILAPDPRLRPEMLCRAEFLADGRETRSNNPGKLALNVRLFAPEAALVSRNGSLASVWIVQPETMRVRQAEISLGHTSLDGFVEVVAGLLPGDQVVVQPPADLETGDRVKPL